MQSTSSTTQIQGTQTYGFPIYSNITASLTNEEKERTFPNSLRNRSGLKESGKSETTATHQPSQGAVAINVDEGIQV